MYIYNNNDEGADRVFLWAKDVRQPKSDKWKATSIVLLEQFLPVNADLLSFPFFLPNCLSTTVCKQHVPTLKMIQLLAL